MFKHILIPLDGSEFAELAIPVALELAEKFDSEVTLAGVIEVPNISTGEWAVHVNDMLVEYRDDRRDMYAAYLEEWRETVGAVVTETHTTLLEGVNPADVLLSYIENSTVDAVVMTTHGRTGIARWMLGSIAERILRHATVPVMLIRVKGDGAASHTAGARVAEAT